MEKKDNLNNDLLLEKLLITLNDINKQCDLNRDISYKALDIISKFEESERENKKTDKKNSLIKFCVAIISVCCMMAVIFGIFYYCYFNCDIKTTSISNSQSTSILSNNFKEGDK